MIGDMNRKYGSWALVTGASDGIGRAIARELAAGGINVILVARREEVLRALANELETRHGVLARVIAADLALPENIERIERETNDLDVGLLVAAAGFATSGLFLESDLSREREMLAVNCAAPMDLARRFGTRFVRRGGGGIILMSSIVAFQGVPYAADYAATKAYIQTLAEGLRVELRPSGIDVLSVAPAMVRTGFAEVAGMTMGAAATPETIARGAVRALGRRGTVRPGFLASFLEVALTLPRWGRTRIMKLVMGGLTRTHHT